MKKTTAMLEYTKTILQKVSFSPILFAKELKKSLQWLQLDEIFHLRAWCMVTYGDLYPQIIQETFRGLKA